MNYTDLKAADAALGIADLAQAANALNKQTVPPASSRADILAHDVEGVLSQSGEMGKLLDLRNDPAVAMAGWSYPNGVTPAMVRGMVFNLLHIIESPRISVFATSTSAGYSAVQQGLGLLVAMALISSDTQSALTSLTVAQPTQRWVPAVTSGDIQTARTQP